MSTCDDDEKYAIECDHRLDMGWIELSSMCHFVCFRTKYHFQIEHHLFPTMPRSHLSRASVYVKEFCVDNNLPYMCDSYTIGYGLCLRQLANVGRLATNVLKLRQTSST